VDFGERVGGAGSGKVDGLENLAIESLGLRRGKREAHQTEGVGQALDAKANRAVAHIRVAGLRHGVVVAVDNLV